MRLSGVGMKGYVSEAMCERTGDVGTARKIGSRKGIAQDLRVGRVTVVEKR